MKIVQRVIVEALILTQSWSSWARAKGAVGEGSPLGSGHSVPRCRCSWPGMDSRILDSSSGSCFIILSLQATAYDESLKLSHTLVFLPAL